MLAELSNQLLAVGIVLFTAAMAGYAVEYAFGASRAVERVVHAPVRRLATVGGGPDERVPPAPPEAPVATAPATTAPIGRRQVRAAGRAAVAATVAAAACLAGSVATRGAAAGRVPWGNMYEFILVACLVGSVAWLVLLTRRPVRHLGVFVMLALVVTLGIDGMRLYVPVGPLVPALDSYWLKIHVVAAASSTGLLLLGFVVAVLFLLRRAHDRRLDAGREPTFPASLGARLPHPQVLDRLTFRLHATVFPLWTFAIITGAIWAESAWGSYWSWDPKETWAFISWICYAAYLHARATSGAARRQSAWIAVVGWATMCTNLFVVNLYVSGLHSYAGI